MKQEYFVVVLAHSLRGRLRRIQIPHQAVYLVLALAAFGAVFAFGLATSYARMAWKVSNYNALRLEAEQLRARYQNLQKVASQTNEQLASLEVFAREVTVAYGIKQKLEGPADISARERCPDFAESVADYNYLRTANSLQLASRANRVLRTAAAAPSIWPVDGRLLGGFGSRTDPFSGEGEFHKGVDISGSVGTPIRVTGDGIVVKVEMENGFGRLIVVDHGGGLQTYYAHLSRFGVQVGQDVRRGEIIGAVGTSGRVTAPHLHYEVRLAGTPMNPMKYLNNVSAWRAPVSHELFPF